MITTIILAAAIIFICVLLNRVSSKLGIPMLLFFILLGMVFGSDGIVKIHFDNYGAMEQISSLAMVFIMFYGGFGTKWSAAKPVALKATLLSSLGTVFTAGFVGLFCMLVLKIQILESFLIGAVICSTDAASVFSILRSRKLALKDNTASLLEVESGSNDPFSYMLTVIILALMNGDVTTGGFLYMLFAQVVYGAAMGVLIAVVAIYVLKKIKIRSGGLNAIFMVAVALLAYGIPSYIGGNGFLSVYIAGIIIGNTRIPEKQELVSFFDGVTGLMQMLLFFLLGLLSFPSQFPKVALPAFLIALFLTFVARPLAVFAILTPFKSNFKQQLLVSWSGMRGAASIVFAILVVISAAEPNNDIFHMVFFIVLFSILLQGSLLPLVSKKLGMIDENDDVMKTFTDYSDEVPIQFLKFTVDASHEWVNKSIKDITLPPNSIIILIINGEKRTVPDGNTVISAGDTIILSGESAEGDGAVRIFEVVAQKGDDYSNKKVCNIDLQERLIIMIKRSGSVVIPNGDTDVIENDVLVMMDR